MARLVLQSESIKGVKVFHLAVMRDGSIGEHNYTDSRNHRNNAHYLCRGEPKHDYQTWDNLDLGPIHRILTSGGTAVEERLCEKCLGITEGAE